MSIFSDGYSSDSKIGLEALCDLSKALMKLSTYGLKDRLQVYGQQVDMLELEKCFYEAKNIDALIFYTQELCGSNELCDKAILNDVEMLRQEALLLKKHIDDVVNRVSDSSFLERLNMIRMDYINQSNVTKTDCKNTEEKEKLILQMKKNTSEFEEIIEFKKACAQRDFNIGLKFIKTRQWLRKQIYDNLQADSNMTGKEICEHINDYIRSLDEDIVQNLYQREYYRRGKFDEFFSPYDIYNEWNSVKKEMENGTFGKNYPDNISDDIEIAKQQLKELGVNILIPKYDFTDINSHQSDAGLRILENDDDIDDDFLDDDDI